MEKEQNIDLTAARIELDQAKKEFDLMRNIFELDILEVHWANLLDHIEKSWNKTVQAAKEAKGFQKVKSEVENLRKTDPLLKYMTNARHANQHTIQPLAKKGKGDFAGMGKLLMTDANGNSKVVGEEPGYWTIVELLPFTNRNVTFTVPGYHRGNRIANDAFEIGRITIQYYQQVLDRVSSL
ncbi:hypothetical protein [Dyadobacter sp. OTU695]|uniref:hypothetical protein n=1 Tax=Dyadobacter sp. OTU695 TaxID=3043860 RepID=UPI00313CD79E